MDHCILDISGIFLVYPTEQFCPIKSQLRLRKPHLNVKVGSDEHDSSLQMHLFVCLGFYAVSTVVQLSHLNVKVGSDEHERSLQMHLFVWDFTPYQLYFSYLTVTVHKSMFTDYFSLFPKRQILDSFKLKDFADDNSRFDENGRKLSGRVKNTTGKGEIARYEQFLLFPKCFQKTCTADT